MPREDPTARGRFGASLFVVWRSRSRGRDVETVDGVVEGVVEDEEEEEEEEASEPVMWEATFVSIVA